MKRNATLVSIAAVLAYFVAVAERSSLGVAAIQASERFDVTAAQLSSLTVMQLAVYAAMQLPVGVLLDRYGSRRLIVVGAIFMAAGQLYVASADSLGQAVFGRAILGMGDAFTFISMIRLINHWYAGPIATRRTQFYANIGQLGQVFSTIPFAFFLHQVGWSSGYTALGALALLSALVAWIWIKESPTNDAEVRVVASWRTIASQVLENLRNPSVRMAFWVHFTCQSSGSVFVLLWGYTYLVRGQGVSPTLASIMLSSFVGIGFLIGPLLSHLCATRPEIRGRLVVITVLSIIAAWSLVLLWPGQSPIGLLWLLILVIGSGGPASMIAFDFTRSYIRADRMGSANGLVNMGGFIATFVIMYAVGLVLDFSLKLHWSESLFDAVGLRLAMMVQFLILGIGLVAFWLERRRVERMTLVEK